MVDSAAEFSLRVGQLGLRDHEPRMTEAGVKTFAQLAFYSGYQPGGSEEAFNDSLAAPLLGARDHAQRPGLRRLFTEAYTLSAADLQRRVEPRTDLSSTPLPSAEREARLRTLLNRLQSLVVGSGTLFTRKWNLLFCFQVTMQQKNMHTMHMNNK